MLWLSYAGWACDNCNIYLNTSPNDYKNSIGIFMRQRQMYGKYSYFGEMIATKHAGHGYDPAFWGKEVFERFQTYELRGSFYIREKWKTTVIFPYIKNNQQIDNFMRYKLNGIGDPILMQSYQVFTTKKDTVKKKFNQRLLVGLGIKFPLGKIDLKRNSNTPNLDLQPGTGSYDGFTYLIYTAKYKFVGLTSNINLKVNGKNIGGYRYGKTLNATLNFFTDLKIKSSTVRLLGGGYLEAAGFDESYSADNHFVTTHKDTGGKAYFLNTGIKLFVGKFLIFGEYQTNIKNQLNGYTQLLNRDKINTGVIYNF